MVNGNRRRILEVGMQSAYVEIGKSDRVGDEVVLLGEGLSELEVAGAWGTTEHECLTRLARM
jgi:alanine racemase